MLACDHGCSCGHAYNVLIVGTRVVDAVSGEVVDRRCSRGLTPIAAKRIEAHLIGCDEQNISFHNVT